MLSKITNLRINFVRRNARKNGPAYSQLINDSFDELSVDLNNLSQQWNSYLVPLAQLLPAGQADDGKTICLDAFSHGIDGSTLYVDADATVTDESVFYNLTQERPNSIKEQFDAVYLNISNVNDELREEISSVAGVLTESQKTRIGANIFYQSQTSSSDSLDGLSQINKENILQLAKDIYDDSSGYQLNRGGDPLLTYSIRDHLAALLAIHNGTFDADLTLSHAGQVNASDLIGQVSQGNVAKSASYNDNWSGTASSLQDDMNELRTLIKQDKGVAGYKSSLKDYTLSDTDIQSVIDWCGTGVRDASNPWGVAYSDLDDEDWQSVVGLLSVMQNVSSFTGMTDFTDGAPTFTSVNFVTQGSSGGTLEKAIGELDLALFTHESDVLNPHQVTLSQAASQGGTAPADQVLIDDSAEVFTSSTVEGALEEVMLDTQQVSADLVTLSGDLTGRIVTLSGVLSGDITTLSGQLTSYTASVSGILQSHLDNTSNPHQVTAHQVGASGIIAEINTYASSRFERLALPLDTLYDEDLVSHQQGTVFVVPSGEHWAEDIDCSITLSGLSTPPTLAASGLNNVITYAIEGTGFRRQDTLFDNWTDSSTIDIVHGKSVLPFVQVVRYDTNAIILQDISIQHTQTTNPFDTVSLTNSTGDTVPSGIVLLQW